MNLILGLVFLLFSFASYANVDLERYQGKWFEIASIPQFFQKKCIKNTTAEYSIVKDNMMKVMNSCESKNGVKTAEARAKVADEGDNSKFKVTFVKVIGWLFLLAGDYWILDVDESYSMALIGSPTKKYAWILSRGVNPSIEQLKYAEKFFKEKGYKTCEILTSIQDGGFQEKLPLCEIVGRD